MCCMSNWKEVLGRKLTSMGEKKRYSALDWGFLMNKMDVEGSEAVNADGCFAIGELVDFGFCLSPIVLFLPVFGQAFDVCQWGSIAPPSFIKLIREIGG